MNKCDLILKIVFEMSQPLTPLNQQTLWKNDLFCAGEVMVRLHPSPFEAYFEASLAIFDFILTVYFQK